MSDGDRSSLARLSTAGDRIAGEHVEPEATVDWSAVVAAAERVASIDDVGAHLLEVASGITTAAAHMFVIGRYLARKKKEVGHGNYLPLLAEKGISRRTASKYVRFAGRMTDWVEKMGTDVPISVVRRLLDGDPPRQPLETVAAVPSTSDDEGKLSAEVTDVLVGAGFKKGQARDAARAALAAGHRGDGAIKAALQLAATGTLPAAVEITTAAATTTEVAASNLASSATVVADSGPPMQAPASTLSHKTREFRGVLRAVAKRWSDGDDLNTLADFLGWALQEVDGLTLARIRRELDRVHNRVALLDERFQAAPTGRGTALISRGSWTIEVPCRKAIQVLSSLAAGVRPPGAQLLARTGREGTIDDKADEIRAALEGRHARAETRDGAEIVAVASDLYELARAASFVPKVSKAWNWQRDSTKVEPPDTQVVFDVHDQGCLRARAFHCDRTLELNIPALLPACPVWFCIPCWRLFRFTRACRGRRLEFRPSPSRLEVRLDNGRLSFASMSDVQRQAWEDAFYEATLGLRGPPPRLLPDWR